jgi:hypothetical protein
MERGEGEPSGPRVGGGGTALARGGAGNPACGGFGVAAGLGAD